MAHDFPVGSSITVDDLSSDLHPTLARLRASEPVSWLPCLNGWLVTDYGLAGEILRDPSRFTVDDERFTTGQVVGPSMLSTDGDKHSHHRHPFEAPFRAGSVADTEGAIGNTVDVLLDGLGPHGRADLRQQLAAPLAVTVISDFLQLGHGDADDREQTEAELLGLYRQIVSAVSGLTAGIAIPTEAMAAVESLGRLVAEATRPASVLGAVSERGSLTANELAANTAVVLFGAIETCEGMTANAFHHVLSQQSMLEQLSSGRVDFGAVVNESLRLEPAAAIVDRYATEPVELGDATIKAGDLVSVSLAGANRDPKVFAEPDHFDPQRPGVGRHLAFARGPHVCLGLHLAKLQTRVALQAAIETLPGLAIDESTSTPPEGLVFRKPPSIQAIWSS